MNLIKKSILFGTALLFSSFSAIAEIKVVTTIKPIHSLVSGVMDGVSNPTLIIEGSNSPHNFSLKPSHAKMLEEADIVFWIGEDLESFMEKPLNSLAKNSVQISFMDLKSIEKLKFREMSDHDDHGHDDHHAVMIVVTMVIVVIVFVTVIVMIIVSFMFIFMAMKMNMKDCLLYTSPSPRDRQKSRMPSSA